MNRIAALSNGVMDRVRPVARSMRARLAVVSPLGWTAIACALAALALAAVFDWGELVAVAAVGLCVMVLAIPFVIGRVAYAARLELASTRVTVGERAVGELIVRSTARRGSAATRIELPVGRARAEFRIPRLALDEEHGELFAVPTQRRALLMLGPVTSVRTDPLGLLRRRAQWTDAVELFVHPRIVRLDAETNGLMRDLEGMPTRDLADDDVSFHALREYAPGDDLRHVHWKSTARTSKLMIRQFEQTRRSQLVVVLSTALEEYADEEEFELAVSIAGSIGVSALREGKAVTLVTTPASSRRKDTARLTPARLLDRLSVVAAEQESPGIVDLAAVAAGDAPAASVAVLVTGSRTPPLTARAAQLRLPTGTRATCVRADPAGRLSRQIVGDVVVVGVPALESLRVAVRAVAA